MKSSPEAFSDYQQKIYDAYENLDYNSKKSRKVLIFLITWLKIWKLIKLKTNNCWIVYKWKRTQCFTDFYIKILSQKSEKYKTKLDIVFVIKTPNKIELQ